MNKGVLRWLTMAIVCSIIIDACVSARKRAEHTERVDTDMSYAATALSGRLRESGHNVIQVGNSLAVGDHRLRVETITENQAQKEGRYLVGLGVRIFLDGNIQPALNSGGVGVDTTQEAAYRTAADEWSRQFGTVLIRALLPQPSDPQPVVTRDHKIYSGPVGLRGGADIKEFDEARKQLSQLIGQFVDRSFPRTNDTEWHGINVMVIVDPQEGQSSMCQLDGKELPELSQALKDTPWPAGANSYMFKQFYLAVPSR